MTSPRPPEQQHIRLPDGLPVAGSNGDSHLAVHAEGIRVTDSAGKTWIDALGGDGTVNIGYGRTRVAVAVHEQMKRITYFPNGTATVPVVELAEKLARITPGSLSRTYMTSSGSEANETAIKIARSYHRRVGNTGRSKVIARHGSEHGFTSGVMGLGGTLTARDLRSLEPLPSGMVLAPQPNAYRCEMGANTSSECATRCAQAIEDIVLRQGPDTVAAVIAEPVAQPPGAVVPGDEYWPMLRAICDRYGVLLIVDEVVCGFGRTGTMFGIEHWGVVPDIMTLGGSISGGYVPLTAVVVRSELADSFGGAGNQFTQTLTASGHPVGPAAALKCIEIIDEEGLLENSARVGSYFKERLDALKDAHTSIGDVRGLGLQLAVELVSDRETKAPFSPVATVAESLNRKFRDRGLILSTDGRLINLTPPISLTRDDVDEIVSALESSLSEMENELGIA